MSDYELEKIIELYHKEDLCMFDLLAGIKCSEMGDLSLEQAHELYLSAMEWAEDKL